MYYPYGFGPSSNRAPDPKGVVCDGSLECKKNKKYKRYDFYLNNVLMYRKNVRYDEKWKQAPIYYTSNNQLYFDPGTIKNQNYAPVYHDNGQLLNIVALYSISPKVDRYISFDAQGNKVFDKSFPIYEERSWGSSTSSDYGNVRYNYYDDSAIAPLASSPSYYPVTADGDTYYGFLDMGEYFSKSQSANFIGSFLSMAELYGKGTVLFMEDYLNKKYYWVVILNGKIRFKYPATEADRPNILALKKNSELSVIDISEYTTMSEQLKNKFIGTDRRFSNF